MASVWTLHIRTASSLPARKVSDEFHCRWALGRNCNCTNWNKRVTYRKLMVKAVDSNDDRPQQNDAIVIGKLKNDSAEAPQQNLVAKLQESIVSLPVFLMHSRRLSGMNFTIGLCIMATMFAVVVRRYVTKKTSDTRPGSVADLVRRGQLRSDRRGISKPLKYEDPFNNPMVKVGKSNSTVEMCGKVYRLAPVALTDEIQTTHQRRRSRAYQWKRPTMFLKEGESVPADVDPDTVSWIPANHPFATTSSDIDEDSAQKNVYQKHGVPSRIQAEHDALQRKLEALQNEQTLGKSVIDPAAAKDLERPLKSEEDGSSNASPSDHIYNSFESKPPSENMQNP